MNFIGRYYKEPEKTWYGDVYIGDQITDYDLREGLSRWAIDSYETAKSEKVDGVDKKLSTLLSDFDGACVEFTIKIKEENDLDEPGRSYQDDEE